MPFTNDGASYEELLAKLRDNRSSWDSARTFADCQEAIAGISDIDNAKFGALAEELRSYHGDDDELMLRQLYLTALAWPASDYGLTGAEWQGYFITALADGREVYAADRFADPDEWANVEVATQTLALTYDQQTGLMYDEENWYLPDGKTTVRLDQADPAKSRDEAGNLYLRGVLQEGAATASDLRQTHFDQETQRWRRWSDDGGEFEYYHNDDGVWERLGGKDTSGGNIWNRYHSTQHDWLRYDQRSGQWFDPGQNQWCTYERVGAAAAPAPAGQAEQDLDPTDLEPELQTFLAKLYELDPETRNVPIRTVLEMVADSEREL
jgi:hypothetical protein